MDHQFSGYGISEPRFRALTRKVWRRIALRNLTASDNHRQLNRLYAVPDPGTWSPPENSSVSR